MKKIFCILLCALLLSLSSGCTAETFTEEHYTAGSRAGRANSTRPARPASGSKRSTDGQIHIRYSEKR